MSYKDSFDKDFDAELAKLRSQKVNLMVIGGTGVGKSSLINRVFGENKAAVGAGKPITRQIALYTSENSSINIFDTIGYELQDEANTENLFEQHVLAEIDRRASMALSEQIHAIWYCISITNHRVLPYDTDQIMALAKHRIPLFIVFTKCDEDAEGPNGEGKTATEFRKVFSEEPNLKNIQIFETAATSKFDFDLDALLTASVNALGDEQLRNAFNAAQIRNLPLKKDAAAKWIHAAAVSAAAAGAIPIPGPDAPVIAGIQLGLAAKLAYLYDMSIFGQAASMLKTQLLSFTGRQLVTSLSKFIPGFGSVISAAVASTLTEAFGWALVQIYESALETYLTTGEEPEWSKIFAGNVLSDTINQFLGQSVKNSPVNS